MHVTVIVWCVITVKTNPYDLLTMSKQEEKKLEQIIYTIVIVAVVAAFLGIPQWFTNWVIQWLVSAFIGGVFSLLATSVVEEFTGDFLKTISLTFEVQGFEFSVTAFAIATIIVKYWFFHSF